MKEKVIVDTPEEKVIIRWDGIRFAIVVYDKKKHEIPLNPVVSVTLFNPREMMEIVKFAGALGEGELGKIR